MLPPEYKIAIKAANRNDDVKLSAAIAKLKDEDPGVHFEQVAETHEAVLMGQGEVHLRTALSRMERKFGLKLATHAPHVGYRETIRKPESLPSRISLSSQERISVVDIGNIIRCESDGNNT